MVAPESTLNTFELLIIEVLPFRLMVDLCPVKVPEPEFCKYADCPEKLNVEIWSRKVPVFRSAQIGVPLPEKLKVDE